MTPINLSVFMRVYGNLRGKVKYRLGAKLPLALPSARAAGRRCDCSGFARYITAKATGGRVELPDGSTNQMRWCEKTGLHKLRKYEDVLYGDTSRLFIAFLAPRRGKPGHVWFVRRLKDDAEPVTFECRSRHGVSSRAWNAVPAADKTFEVPTL